MVDQREIEIIRFIQQNKEVSSKEIHDGASVGTSYATTKRIIAKLVSDNFLIIRGQGKGTKYLVSSFYELTHPIDVEEYFEKEIDNREIFEHYNFGLISEVLAKNSLFNDAEWNFLTALNNRRNQRITQLTPFEYKNELERLAIDLSWKSSQIEGNTYSLLETERLLKEKVTADGKTKEEAIMLLNHKEAIDFIVENPDFIFPLSLSKIEEIHKILVKDLGIDINLRRRRVGISGTNYRPLDNEFQIKEALQSTCDLINNKKRVFDKALLALLLISYIQPFVDGNKRTARIISNAILIHYQFCPISFRTVDSIEYKKALLIFYERNNISAFKRIFIQQFEFAVNTYF